MATGKCVTGRRACKTAVLRQHPVAQLYGSMSLGAVAASAFAMAAKKPTQIGNYRVIREIGRGGMGAVYEAEHQRVKNRVAIKVLHPEYCRDPQIVARFRQEPMAANLPGHAGIAHVIESEVLDDGTPYIVMEYLDGDSLRQRIRKARGGLSELSAVRFGKQVADALAAAHAKKIVHRDIKPENIMIVRDDAVAGGERAKVLDFGIAVVGRRTRDVLVAEQHPGADQPLCQPARHRDVHGAGAVSGDRALASG